MNHDDKAYVPFMRTYVVWHPSFNQGSTGQAVAERMYREFCRDPDKPMATAIGLPILFRTSAGSSAPPLPIDFASAQHNVVIVLLDHKMALDNAFRAYVRTISDQCGDPVRNLLLVFKWGNYDLFLGNAQQIVVGTGKQDPMETLRLTFAAEACRMLRNQPRVDRAGVNIAPDPPRLFISHAKRDAEDKALEIKGLVEATPVNTFFDRVDIAAGYDFTTEIHNNIKQSAVLAWQSDEYASRPWCNMELLTAKEHQRPIVVVLSVKTGEERSFPYLGNVRTIVATENNSTEIIIAAVREYLRKLYADGHFQTLEAAGLIPSSRFRLFRPPEPIDGALLERKHQPERDAAKPNTLPESAITMYPDPPLSTAELDMMERLFPDLTFVTPSTVDGRSLSGLIVALSISEPEDLLTLGLSRVHLQTMMNELARHVLARGGTLAYGGDLRMRAEFGLSRHLFEIVHAYSDLGRQPVERIRNYLAHHIAAEFPEEEEATLLKLADFVKPRSEVLDVRFGLKPGMPVPDDTAEHRYIRSRSLSVMREAMAIDINARVFVGGRVSGHQGKYPGILEEAALTLGRRPMFLMGGFGGCTRLIIEALRDKTRPGALTTAAQRSSSRKAKWIGTEGTTYEQTVTGAELMDSYDSHSGEEIDDGPIDYEGIMERFRRADIASLNNGLNKEENLELFETTDVERTITLLVKGLGAGRTRNDK